MLVILVILVILGDGVSTNGVAADVHVFGQMFMYFLGTPANLLLSPQKSDYLKFYPVRSRSRRAAPPLLGPLPVVLVVLSCVSVLLSLLVLSIRLSSGTSLLLLLQSLSLSYFLPGPPGAGAGGGALEL